MFWMIALMFPSVSVNPSALAPPSVGMSFASISGLPHLPTLPPLPLPPRPSPSPPPPVIVYTVARVHRGRARFRFRCPLESTMRSPWPHVFPHFASTTSEYVMY